MERKKKIGERTAKLKRNTTTVLHNHPRPPHFLESWERWSEERTKITCRTHTRTGRCSWGSCCKLLLLLLLLLLLFSILSNKNALPRRMLLNVNLLFSRLSDRPSALGARPPVVHRDVLHLVISTGRRLNRSAQPSRRCARMKPFSLKQPQLNYAIKFECHTAKPDSRSTKTDAYFNGLTSELQTVCRCIRAVLVLCSRYVRCSILSCALGLFICFKKMLYIISLEIRHEEVNYWKCQASKIKR